MTVYFVYRNGYAGPTGKLLRTFDDETVLDWFANRWQRLCRLTTKKLGQSIKSEIGLEVPFLVRLFSSAAAKAKAPKDPAALLRLVKRSAEAGSLPDEAVCSSPNCFQVYTWDPDADSACYFFDDHYLKDPGMRDQASFLLHEEWELPSCAGFTTGKQRKGSARRGIKAGGYTHLLYLGETAEPEDDEYRDCFPCRLSELARELLRKPLKIPVRNRTGSLRSLLPVERKKVPRLESVFLNDIRENPNDELTWNTYSDWLQDQGELPAGLHLLKHALLRIGANSLILPAWSDIEIDCNYCLRPVKESYEEAVYLAGVQDRGSKTAVRVQVEDHRAQVSYPWKDSKRSTADCYSRWIFFDDVWEAAHPALANALLRYGEDWQVLA